MNQKELQNIVDFFALGEILSVKKAGGHGNDNFFIATRNGDYFLKVVREQYGVKEKIHEKLFLKRLEENGFPIALYLSSPNGEIIYTREDVIALVQKKLDGSPPTILDANIVTKLGSALAVLHSIPSAGLPDKKNWLSRDYLPNAVDILKREFPDLEDVQELMRLYKKLYVSFLNFPQSIIHGDLFFDNTLFKDGNLVAIIDWEEAGIEASILDFGMAVNGLCFPNDYFDELLYRALYQSYNTGRQMQEVEIENITAAVKYAAITTAIWRFLRNNYYHPEKKLKERYKLFWKQGLHEWEVPKV